MSNKITGIVGKIVNELESLTSDERKRAIAGALAILGESALPADASMRKPPFGGDGEPGGQDRPPGIFSQAGGIWIKKNTLTQAQIEEVFHIEKDKVTLILGEGIGKSKREQTINSYLLTGAAAMLETGSADFTDDLGRQNCITIGCYDAPNHGKYLKGFGNKITGSKTVGWKLTAPGLTTAAMLLKREEAASKMIPPVQALIGLPTGLREPLVGCFNEIARNFAEHRWEPAELNGGKFCEVVYTILEGALGGAFALIPKKPSNMVNACRALETRPANASRVGDRSLRILIPRMLPVLYEIRNNRGVGHVGGEVDPNYQDAVAVYQTASWLMAELVRIFHQVSLAEAQATVNALVERKHPIVWQYGDIRRVLDPSLPKGDQSLLLLYSVNDWCEDKELANWVEYSNLTQFRNRIIIPLHESRALEYDRKVRRVRLTPRGSEDVERRLISKYAV